MTRILTFDNRLCCVWRGGDDSTVNCLVYGDKRIRTYLPGRVDGRLHGVVVQRTALALAHHLDTTPEPCLAPVALCRRFFGWADEDFAEVA
jgi:hypothetical protein